MFRYTAAALRSPIHTAPLIPIRSDSSIPNEAANPSSRRPNRIRPIVVRVCSPAYVVRRCRERRGRGGARRLLERARAVAQLACIEADGVRDARRAPAARLIRPVVPGVVGRVGQPADDGDGRVGRQRQRAANILQQRGALRGAARGERLRLGAADGRRRDRGERAGRVKVAESQAQPHQPAEGRVQ
eukprot:2278844-Prymnesium_polylepis.1